MATKRIIDLSQIDTISSNLSETFLIVVDTSGAEPTTKKASLLQIDESIEREIANLSASFDQANTAWDTANASGILAQAAYDTANSAAAGSIDSYARTHSNSAFESSNNNYVIAQGGYNTANASLLLAQNAYDYANTINTESPQGAYDQANVATTLAQDAYDFANTVSTSHIDEFARTTANVASVDALYYGPNAWNLANTAYALAIATSDDVAVLQGSTVAEEAYSQANTATTLAQDAYDYANTIISESPQDAYDQANVATTLAQDAYDYANTIIVTSPQDAYDTANLAFDQANTATSLAQDAYDYANTIVVLSPQDAYDTANLAFDQANTATTLAQDAYDQANNNTISVTDDLVFNSSNANTTTAGIFAIKGTTSVTQTGLRNSSVTINATSGEVTLVADSMTSGQVQSFVVNCNKVIGEEVVLCSVYGAGIGSYIAGGYTIDNAIVIWIRNLASYTTASESPTIKFVVVRMMP